MLNEKKIIWSKKKRGPRTKSLDASSSKGWSKRQVSRNDKGGRASRVGALETEERFRGTDLANKIKCCSTVKSNDVCG